MTATAAQIAPHHNTLTPLGSRRAALFLACALRGEQRVVSTEHNSSGTFDDDLSRQLIIVGMLRRGRQLMIHLRHEPISRVHAMSMDEFS